MEGVVAFLRHADGKQDLLADALGLPGPTVMHLLQGLRSAGLIASGGRGVSATAMSKNDAIA